MTEPRSTRRIARAANVFDLRRIIGGLFVVYGLLLAILGLFEDQQAIDRAQGININLWGGLAMLVFGVLMVLWALARPLSEQLGSEQPGGRAGDDAHRAGGERDAGPEQR